MCAIFSGENFLFCFRDFSGIPAAAARACANEVVGTTGFEPATSRTPSVRATRLRYVPTVTAFLRHCGAKNRRKSQNFRVSLGFKQRQERPQRVA